MQSSIFDTKVTRKKNFISKIKVEGASLTGYVMRKKLSPAKENEGSVDYILKKIFK